MNSFKFSHSKFALLGIAFLSVASILISTQQGCSPGFKVSTELSELSSISDTPTGPDIPDSLKPGSCQKLPMLVTFGIQENAAVYDPVSKDIIHYSGHTPGSYYVQNSYAFRYNYRTMTVGRAHPKRSPPRQCLSVGAYVDRIKKPVYVHGNVSHGSISIGGFHNGYTKIGLADNIGPWIYDPVNDSWELARTPNGGFDVRPHAPVAYDSTSDVYMSLGYDRAYIYISRTNETITRTIPDELKNRYYYGIAADPVHRKFVVFGGSVGPWNMTKDTLPVGYSKYMRQDTWIYDVATDKWTKIKTALTPPKGTAGTDFVNHNMMYESRTGTISLRVIPLNQYVADAYQWPAAENWSFDLRTNQWHKVEWAQNPPLVGMMAYDPEANKFLLLQADYNTNENPNAYREIYSCSPPEIGVPVNTPDPQDLRLSLNATNQVTLNWTPSQNEPYVVYRAIANPTPGVFEEIGRSMNGQYVDSSTQAGKVYAYQVSKAGLSNKQAPVYNQPDRLSGLFTSVESEKLVKLRWNKSDDPFLAGYNVYRGKGDDGYYGGGEKLNSTPLQSPSFEDTTVDLSDKVGQFYWVKAVNIAGIESGPSPWSVTMPEAPMSANIEKINDKTFRITWDYEATEKVAGFYVYHVDKHINTIEVSETKMYEWYASWKPTTTEPIQGREFIFTVPEGSTAQHHYFYIRAVNVLGQPGFFTDIISATNPVFVPHVAH